MPLDPRETDASVRAFYARDPAREWRRLAKDPLHRLELDTTLRFLRKHLPPGGLVLDAGGGPGRYTIELARDGHDVVLLDLASEHLELARRRIARAGVKKRVPEIVEGSICDLSRWSDARFDAVVCLGGPLSHVDGADRRLTAVRELARVAKPGAPVVLSVMGRLAVLAESARYWPGWIAVTDKFGEAWRTGDDRLWCGTSFAHFFLPEELVELVEAAVVDVVECVGLEGLGSHSVAEINRLARDPVAWRNWLDAHEALCTHPAVFATSQHMLVVGRAPAGDGPPARA
jgi:SAM-dependent methyltransferase